MFTNWKRKYKVLDALLRDEIRRECHAKEYNIRELEKTRKELTTANAAFVEARKRLADVAACETPSANATVRRMARIARGEAVDAGPVPVSAREGQALADAMKQVLRGDEEPARAFAFHNTKQGLDYWWRQNHRKTLTPEARAIIQTWIAELERGK